MRTIASCLILLLLTSCLPLHLTAGEGVTAGSRNAMTVVPAPSLYADRMLLNRAPTAQITVRYGPNFPANLQPPVSMACQVWGYLLVSARPIVVFAKWDTLDEGTLAAAGPLGYRENFPGAAEANVLYPIALAEMLSGQEMNGDTSEIVMKVNSRYRSHFSTSLEGVPQRGKYDLVTVAMHEIAHGLGFIESFEVNQQGIGSWGSWTGGHALRYDRFCVVGNWRYNQYKLTSTIHYPNPSLNLGAVLRGGDVFFDGANAWRLNQESLPKLWAPPPWKSGSSIAHLDTSMFPSGTSNSLLKPIIDSAEVIHSPGEVGLAILQDLGWNVNSLITVTSPAPGEVVQRSTDLIISWTDTRTLGGPISIDLMRKNAFGVFEYYGPIAVRQSYQGPNQHVWTVVQDTGVYRIKMLNHTLNEGYGLSSSFSISNMPKVAMPVLSFAPGQYSVEIDVTMTCSTPTATIHYTTNGGEPTEQSQTYTAPVRLPNPSSTRLRAKAFAQGMAASDESGGWYYIGNLPGPPEVHPDSGTYPGPMRMYVTWPTGTECYVTVNSSFGTEPPDPPDPREFPSRNLENSRNLAENMIHKYKFQTFRRNPDSWSAVVSRRYDVAPGLRISQRDSSGLFSFGRWSRWEDIGAWRSYPDTTIFRPASPTQFILLANQEYRPGTRQKFRVWKERSAETPHNHATLTADAATPELTAYFRSSSNARITTGLVDASIPGGNVAFKDPWLVDSIDHLHADVTVNRGFSAPLKSRPTPFTIDSGSVVSGDRHRGVFLNQNSQWDSTKPNYSVGAPETQSISDWESYFVGWYGHPDSAAFQYPGSTTTGVVFKQPNATVTARYKAHLGSSTPAATAANNQRKIVTVEGVHHAVYESAGDVYYTRSLNGGSTWSAEKLISDGSGMNRQPSLAVLPSIVIQGGVFVGVVWEKYEDAFGLSNLRFRRLDLLQSLWLPTVDIESIPLNDRPLVGFEGATPVVSGVPGLWCIVWKRPNSEWTGSPGLCLWVYDEQGVQGAHYGVLEGTSDASKHPALHYVQENTSWFRLAWSQEGDIFYSEFFPDHGSLNWGTPTDLTAGYSWMISATRPSIVSGAWNSAFVVWEASKDQVVEEEDESPLSGAGGRRQVFLREKTSVWQPVTELSYYWGTDEITPVVGLDNSKVTVLWNWGVTGLAKASRDLIGSGWSIAHVGYGYWPALPGYTQTGTPLRMSTGVPGPPHAVQFQQDPPSSPLADSKAGEEPGVSGAGGGVLVSRTATLVLDSLSIPSLGRGAVSGRVIVTASLPEVRTESGRLPVSFRRDTLKFERWLETEGTAITPNATEARLPVALLLRGVRINKPGVPTSFPVLQAGMRAGSKSTLLGRVTIGDLLASAGRDTTIRMVSVVALDRHRNATLEFTQRLSGVEEDLVAWTEMVSADTTLDAEPAAAAPAAKQPAAATLLPETFLIRDAFPNPFNPSTHIRYELPEPARVSLTVYDVLGRVVETLVDETKEAGYHTVHWNAAGRSSGVYLARFTATTATGTVALQRTVKLVLTK